MLKSVCLILAIALVNSNQLYGQLSYRLSNYMLEEYGAGNQNWDIATDEDRILVANNLGLIILQNTDVQFFEVPDRTVFRSVSYINNRIYTGSFEEFGYWETDESQNLYYTSLSDLLEAPMLQNDEIWKIVEHENKIYFHSFGSIYALDGEKVYRLDTVGSYMFLYKTGTRAFTQRIGSGLFELVEDSLIAIPGSDFLADEEIRGIIPYQETSLLIGTTKGIYVFDGRNFETWGVDNIEEVLEQNINTLARTEDKIIIGTILNGLYIYDSENNFLANINTESQLQNNTILSIAVDAFENIWVGMDKGFSYIAFDSPLHTYRSPTHEIGSVYTGALFNNELYVGTNQGIFWYKRDAGGNFYDQSLIPGSQGQVWFIQEFDDQLYAGLNDGTYLIKDKELIKVSSIFGGYALKPYTKENTQYLLESTYNDLVVYQKEEDIWQESYLLSNFSSPARFLEFDYIGNIWLGHSIKGIYRLQPNIQFTQIDQVDRVGEEMGISESANRVFKLDNRIMTSFGDTLFEWDSIDEKFTPFNRLNEYFTEKGEVQNIVPAGNHRYWVIKHNELLLFEIHFNSIRLIYRLIPKMFNYQFVESYENVIPLSEQLHFICMDDGFAILNLDLANQNKYPKPTVVVNTLESTSSDYASFRSVTSNSGSPTLPSNKNSIRLTWATSQVVGNQTFFQYKLDGLDTDWSDWTPEIQHIYDRLSPGEYTFMVRSIGVDGLLTEVATLPFKIEKPWYFSTGAYFFYFLVVLSFGLMIRLYLSRRRWRILGKEMEEKYKKMNRDRELAEQQVIKLQNEKLHSEIEYKSAQLASNTVLMIRKNNLLNNIKEELKKQQKNLGSQFQKRGMSQIVKLIDDGIKDEHEWQVFEQLYDQAHGDFFKRLKEKYPQLTPSDLRLCAYLRMNLSSKEIAPLLNISVRGVEERRYRLRKRLNLTTDTNLTELIMTF